MAFLLPFVAALLFAGYTDNRWEDFYITYRCSKNLALGNGLVYQPGERVHAFTSPLGTLIPAGLCCLAGANHDRMVIWLFRLMSAIALGVASFFAWRICGLLELGGLATASVVGLFSLDAKTLAFSINGMETGFLLLFLLVSIHGMLDSSRHQIQRVGLAWAGLMWTRPDGIIYIGALSLTMLWFNLPRGRSRTQTLHTWVRAGALCTILYAPWILWTWFYYGSPVPNTVMAKGAFIGWRNAFASVARFPGRCLIGGHTIADAYLPAYADMGGWPYSAFWVAHVIGLLASLSWMLTFLSREARALSLSCLLIAMYLNFNSAFPWYYPGMTSISILVLGALLDTLAKQRAILRHLSLILATGLLCLQCALTLAGAYQLRVQQHEIEDGVRIPIGLFLKANAREGDTVATEPLGYIGYYSQLKMYDFLGLCAPEVVRIRTQLGVPAYNLIVRGLRPTWIVLRNNEWQLFLKNDPGLLNKYDVAAHVNVLSRLESYGYVPGAGFIGFDREYYVLHMKPHAKWP